MRGMKRGRKGWMTVCLCWGLMSRLMLGIGCSVVSAWVLLVFKWAVDGWRLLLAGHYSALPPSAPSFTSPPFLSIVFCFRCASLLNFLPWVSWLNTLSVSCRSTFLSWWKVTAMHDFCDPTSTKTSYWPERRWAAFTKAALVSAFNMACSLLPLFSCESLFRMWKTFLVCVSFVHALKGQMGITSWRVGFKVEWKPLNGKIHCNTKH